MNLLAVWLYRCPVCLTDSEDTACDCCGRPLTQNDLVPVCQDPRATSADENAHGSQRTEVSND